MVPVQSENGLDVSVKRGSPKKAIAASLVTGLLVLCYGGFFALADDGHAADDFIHGGTIPSAIGLTLFMLVVTLGFAEMQRRAADGRSPWLAYWGMLAGWILLGVATMFFLFEKDHKLAADLAARGIATQAHVVRQFTTGCSKHGCTTELEYNFVPKGQAAPVVGYAGEGNPSRHPNSEYRYAIATGTLPIMYDPTDASRSMVNWHNSVFGLASSRFISTGLVMMMIALLFATAMFGLMIRPAVVAMSVRRAPGKTMFAN